MITHQQIQDLISGVIAENDLFIISLDISNSNKIRLLIDSMKGIQLDECIKVNRAIEEGLDREIEDFELEVSSPGLDAPFRVKQQYDKSIGQDVEIITKEGVKIQGKLLSAGDNTFRIEAQKTVKAEGKKRKQTIIETLEFAYDQVSKIRVYFTFK
jgi:ribosome maturation factor RimP